jgi:hypothetical protein
MISNRKIRANRDNCLRSTGPKTVAGRTIAARNARRHGLRTPTLSDSLLYAEVEIIAQEIVGDAGPELFEPPRRIAEAEIDILRVRRARRDLVSRELTTERSLLPFSRRNSPNEMAIAQRVLKPWGILKKLPSSVWAQLVVFDRYERRALSRRKFAIRAFDEARAAARTSAAAS